MSGQKPTESATLLTPRLQPFARIKRLSRLWYSVHLEMPATTQGGYRYATDPYTVPTRRWAESKARRLLKSYHKRARYKYSYVYPGKPTN